MKASELVSCNRPTMLLTRTLKQLALHLVQQKVEQAGRLDQCGDQDEALVRPRHTTGGEAPL